MKWEVEQKFKVADLEAVRAKVEAFGAQLQLEEHSDQYFNHPCRDFAATDEALRLRRRNLANELTYKGPRIDQTTKTRSEMEMRLPSGPSTLEEFAQVLETLGFKPMPLVRKQRARGSIPWLGKQVTVALDVVEGLGTYVELEMIASDEDRAAAQEVIASLASHLGLADSERRSYLELLLDKSS